MMVRSLLSCVGSCMRLRSISIFSRCTSSYSSYSHRSHTCGELNLDNVGERVTLCGWAKKKRTNDSLGIAFLPLVDSTGFTQLFLDRKIFQWDDFMSIVKTGSVIEASGIVQARPEKDQRSSIETGCIEVIVDSLKILNDVKNLPYVPETTETLTSEELSLRERPLVLRRSRMQENLRLRSKIAMAMREFLIYGHGFVEVETPTLFRQTSEGAREFIVPTRIPKHFYTLVQSPQQYKQLLMVGGFDRYFQFARCYRDEDLRSNRQPEFTQVDLEMSFVDSDGVMGLTEELVSSTLSKIVPHLNTNAPPYPRIPFKEAMEKYGSDKPDIREDRNDSSTLKFAWITEFPLFSQNDSKGIPESTHHPFTAPLPEDEKLLLSGQYSDLEQVRGQHYDLVVNGVELGGGSIRICRSSLQEHIFKNVLKIPCEEFAHLLKCLDYGCPPHGGIALGFDRLMATICQVDNIKDVIAFPKSHAGRDLLTGAPSTIREDELGEYHIKTVK